jgi:anti-sigma factor ChrR (cupin superfamily)
MTRSDGHDQDHAERVHMYALQALPSGEMSAMEAHIAGCAQCRREMESLRPVVEAFAAWPTDVLRPPAPLWGRVAQQVFGEAGGDAALPAPSGWKEPEWEEAAPGISVKLLAADTTRDRVTMLVRLGPGVAYPPHTHAGTEELHLLEGELWIEDRKLYPGDYNRGEPGTSDQRVWSETGCTCVLITSPSDVIK